MLKNHGPLRSTAPIPQVQLQNYALLVPKDLYGNGAAVTEIHRGPNRVALQMTAEGSNILPGVSTRPGVNMLPGRHTVQVNVCHASITKSCNPDTYVFEAKPGVAYVLRGPMQTIVMLDRFNKSPLWKAVPQLQKGMAAVNWLHDGTGSTTGHQSLPDAPV